MKKFYLLILMVTLTGESAFTHNLCVYENQGNKHCILLETIQNLTFSEDHVYVKKTDNTVSDFLIFNVRKIEVRTNYYTKDKHILIVDGEMKIFPNPVEDMLTIESLSKMKQIYLFDMYGNLVLKQEIDAHRPTLQLTNLPAGIYNLEIITATGNYEKKIIKK